MSARLFPTVRVLAGGPCGPSGRLGLTVRPFSWRYSRAPTLPRSNCYCELPAHPRRSRIAFSAFCASRLHSHLQLLKQALKQKLKCCILVVCATQCTSTQMHWHPGTQAPECIDTINYTEAWRTGALTTHTHTSALNTLTHWRTSALTIHYTRED